MDRREDAGPRRGVKGLVLVDPVVIQRGSYRLPTTPGYSAEMRPESLAAYAYPDGVEWAAERAATLVARSAPMSSDR